MKRALLLLLLTACAAQQRPASSPCGNQPPVRVLIDSGHFADVWVRDADGSRIGFAPGLRVSEFKWCLTRPMEPRFILDPVAGEFGQIIQAETMIVPGSTVIMTLGSELRISFARVLSP